ncbi:hypothetical protein [Moorena sp. SIO2C4]|nr:hypothetical protein [Moorena sp. SIO2C4]
MVGKGVGNKEAISYQLSAYVLRARYLRCYQFSLFIFQPMANC